MQIYTQTDFIADNMNSMNGSRELLYTYEQCRQIDKASIASGISETSLMGNAALGSLHYLKSGILAKFINSSALNKTRLIVLCGSGNNGGDGLALSWFILSDQSLKNLEIKIYLTRIPEDGPSLFYYKKLLECSVIIKSGENFFLEEKILKSDIIIEALLGNGQTKSPKGLIREILNQISLSRESWPDLKIVSLDVPAGLSEDASVLFTKIPDADSDNMSFSRPDEIHCYGLKKTALVLNSGLNKDVICHTIPIGLHPNAVDDYYAKSFQLPFQSDLKYFHRDLDGHKYNAGHGILIGGSPGMEGAVIMAAKSFFAAGGGILHVFTPNNLNRSMLTQSIPSIMIHDINEIFNVSKAIAKFKAVLIGPGLDPENLDSSHDLLIGFLDTLPESQNIILDAAATRLVNSIDYPAKNKLNTLIIPHTGEWVKLGGSAISNQNQLNAAMQLQKKMNCTVVVKDSISIILKDQMAWIYSYPEPRLSVAGSGDVLAGIILRIFSRDNQNKATVLNQIHSALYLHHCAADIKGYPNSDDIINNIAAFIN